MSAELVHYTVSDAIAQITLDRAPVNALSMPLIDALLEALEKAKDDASVRAVIVCSAHKVFCAGLDLDIVRGKRGTETKLFLERLYFALNDVQYRMGKPTIAAVDGPARAVRCAQEIVKAVRSLGLEIRAGVHTGEVEMMGDDVGGIAVHIAARVAARANANEVLASSTVRDLVAGAGLTFVEQGPTELKGLSEPMRLFSAVA